MGGSRALYKVHILISIMSISSLNPMFDYLLESSHWDDSNKWSNIGIGQEITQVELTELMHLIWSSGGSLPAYLPMCFWQEVERQDNHGNMKTFLQLSDKDAEEELMFWADKRQMKKKCKIRHAWARTIHTFQVGWLSASMLTILA